MSTVYLPGGTGGWIPQHCLCCRYNSYGYAVTTITTPTYQPKHRKPGPAQ